MGNFSSVAGPVNLYCTVVDLPTLPIPPRSQRNRRDPDLLPHVHGLAGWIMAQAGGRAPTAAQAHAIEHAWRVQNQLVFEIGPEHDDAIGRLARDANAIVFLADGTLRDPSGGVIVGGPGRGDVPYPELGHERRRRSRAQLQTWGLETPEHLPPSPSELEVAVRGAEQVAARMRGLARVAVSAESASSGDRIPNARLSENFPDAMCTDDEQEFLAASRVSQEQINRFGFRYEAVLALQWALGIVPELPFPQSICDAGAVIRTMLEPGATSVALRPTSELLDALDVHYRLHWWAVDRRIRGIANQQLDEGVIYERRIALQWLIELGGFDWEEMPAPT